MWPACSKNWAGSNMPDLTSCIWFSSVFPKKAWIILCKTNLDLIWMAWSGFGQMHLVWKQAGVNESYGPVLGRTQPAHYQFPTFRLSSIHPQMPQIILYKNQPGSYLVLADCVSFRPNRSVLEALSGPLLANASQPIQIGMWIGSGMFTGLYQQWCCFRTTIGDIH